MQLISLKNFKSYENQIVNNLNTNVNVIIGRNGEGKSNFFKGTLPAIQLSHSPSLTASPSTATSTTPTSTYRSLHSESYRQQFPTYRSRALRSQ